MKKLTKITALVLALALVLGMTAFAGTASQIVYTDDFDEETANAWKQASSQVAITYADGRTTKKVGSSDVNITRYFDNETQATSITSGITPGARFFNQIAAATSGDETTTTNGYSTSVINGVSGLEKNEATNNGWYMTGEARQIGYMFPETVTYDENYAYVAAIDHIVHATSGYGNNGGGRGIYGHQQNAVAGVILTTKAEDATEMTYADGLLGYTANPKAIPNQVDYTSNTQQTHANHPIIVNPVGNVNTLYSVIVPYEAGTADAGLDILTYVNRNLLHNGKYRVEGYNTVSKIHGVHYNFQSYIRSRFENYRFYKVSLDPADFAITSSTALNGVLHNAGIEIALSQPIAKTIAGTTQNTLLSSITVTPEGGEALVYGEDYTIDVEEKASESAVYDVIKITPAESWSFGTTYTVGLPTGMANIAGVAMTDATAEDDATVATVAFTTVDAPNFAMTLDAYKGLSATGTALTALDAGTTYFAVSAIQDAGVPMTNGTVRIEILDADGNVVKYAAAKKEFSTTAATFGVAFKVEAGQTARAFVVGVNGVATK